MLSGLAWPRSRDALPSVAGVAVAGASVCAYTFRDSDRGWSASAGVGIAIAAVGAALSLARGGPYEALG